jgi:hypothetical protein
MIQQIVFYYIIKKIIILKKLHVGAVSIKISKKEIPNTYSKRVILS